MGLNPEPWTLALLQNGSVSLHGLHLPATFKQLHATLYPCPPIPVLLPPHKSRPADLPPPLLDGSSRPWALMFRLVSKGGGPLAAGSPHVRFMTNAFMVGGWVGGGGGSCPMWWCVYVCVGGRVPRVVVGVSVALPIGGLGCSAVHFWSRCSPYECMCLLPACLLAYAAPTPYVHVLLLAAAGA